jgi:GDP/UDP-N,N'-diacetylbacillosamine 2-epimerase (hydrolysing)
LTAKRKILVVTADRAEHGLLTPVMKELEQREDIEAKWCYLSSKHYEAQNIIAFHNDLITFNPDIVLIPCDRKEMVGPAALAFHEGYVVAHFHAGSNNTNHPDDFNRRAISLFSHIMLCNMHEHKENLVRQGEEVWRIHVVNSTAFDHIEFDDVITPKEPFDLAILHPNPESKEKTYEDVEDMWHELRHSPYTVWIYPNHDRNYEIIENFLNPFDGTELQPVKTYKNLPRRQYLSLLKNCTRAIGNSSSFYYELPIINSKAQFIPIGERNKGLVVPETKVGGSKRIAEILATIELSDRLVNKKFGVKPCPT